MSNKAITQFLIINLIVLLMTITLSCLYGYFRLGDVVANQRLQIEQLEQEKEVCMNYIVKLELEKVVE